MSSSNQRRALAVGTNSSKKVRSKVRSTTWSTSKARTWFYKNNTFDAVLARPLAVVGPNSVNGHEDLQVYGHENYTVIITLSSESLDPLD